MRLAIVVFTVILILVAVVEGFTSGKPATRPHDVDVEITGVGTRFTILDDALSYLEEFGKEKAATAIPTSAHPEIEASNTNKQTESTQNTIEAPDTINITIKPVNSSSNGNGNNQKQQGNSSNAEKIPAKNDDHINVTSDESLNAPETTGPETVTKIPIDNGSNDSGNTPNQDRNGSDSEQTSSSNDGDHKEKGQSNVSSNAPETTSSKTVTKVPVANNSNNIVNISNQQGNSNTSEQMPSRIDGHHKGEVQSNGSSNAPETTSSKTVTKVPVANNSNNIVNTSNQQGNSNTSEQIPSRNDGRHKGKDQSNGSSNAPETVTKVPVANNSNNIGNTSNQQGNGNTSEQMPSRIDGHHKGKDQSNGSSNAPETTSSETVTKVPVANNSNNIVNTSNQQENSNTSEQIPSRNDGRHKGKDQSNGSSNAPETVTKVPVANNSNNIGNTSNQQGNGNTSKQIPSRNDGHQKGKVQGNDSSNAPKTTSPETATKVPVNNSSSDSGNTSNRKGNGNTSKQIPGRNDGDHKGQSNGSSNVPETTTLETVTKMPVGNTSNDCGKTPNQLENRNNSKSNPSKEVVTEKDENATTEFIHATEENTVDQKDNMCKEEGFIPDLTDSSYYYVCRKVGNGFIKVKLHCAYNYHFDVEKSRCIFGSNVFNSADTETANNNMKSQEVGNNHKKVFGHITRIRQTDSSIDHHGVNDRQGVHKNKTLKGNSNTSGCILRRKHTDKGIKPEIVKTSSVCKRKGYYRDKINCSFYSCQFTILGYRKYMYNCPAGLVYNDQVKVCTTPDRVAGCMS